MVTLPESPGPDNSACTCTSTPRKRVRSAVETGLAPAVTITRIPDAVFFGTVALSGEGVALSPSTESSSSPILRSGACARATADTASNWRRHNAETARRDRGTGDGYVRVCSDTGRARDYLCVRG